MYAKLNPLVIGLPENAQKLDGTWVSNYKDLPPDILEAEGWLEAVEVKAECLETQTLVLDHAESDGKTISLIYVAVDVPKDEIDLMLDELEALL